MEAGSVSTCSGALSELLVSTFPVSLAQISVFVVVLAGDVPTGNGVSLSEDLILAMFKAIPGSVLYDWTGTVSVPDVISYFMSLQTAIALPIQAMPYHCFTSCPAN